MSKKILLVGMVDSIHFANWIERLCGSSHFYCVFPSGNYRRIHKKLIHTAHNLNINLELKTFLGDSILSGYFDFFFNLKIMNWSSLSREKRFRKLIKSNVFQIIHIFEFQSAGYLLLDFAKQNEVTSFVIVTNWGSDIHYFVKFPAHELKIRQLLKLADYYSAETMRDYKLAKEYGFSGVELPLLPNSTTFKANFFDENLPMTSKRKLILIKTYGGEIGLGSMLLELVEIWIRAYPHFSFYCYSVTSDLIEKCDRLARIYSDRFEYRTARLSHSHKEMLEKFKSARIYIGASKSDGISTSFLEAIASGAYAIQTSTSGAGEWLSKGIIASVVVPKKTSILEEFCKVVLDDQILDEALVVNRKIAKFSLDFDTISTISQSFYEVTGNGLKKFWEP